MNPDHSIFSYFWHAGPVVKAVMLLLIGSSLYAWTVIFDRFLALKIAVKQARTFRRRLCETTTLAQLHESLSKQKKLDSSEQVFYTGFQAYLSALKRGCSPTETADQVQRPMQIASKNALDHLRTRVDGLATIGSISPYVGLFGTVWGIMGSFQALGQAQSATLTMVAPGIAEALVATAMGLFAAIPAVVAYNRFHLQSEYWADQQDTVESMLISSIERNPTTQPTHAASSSDEDPYTESTEPAWS
jgi:biopolymer transport protein TolQ